MKKISKILSLLLALTMVLSLNLGVLTAHAADYSITINETTNDHVYKIYQIFTGSVDATSGELTNIAYGSGINSGSTTATAAAVAEALTTAGYGTTDSGNISSNYDGEEIVQWLSDNYSITLADDPTVTLSEANGNVSGSEGSYKYSTTTDLPEGYYVIIDSLTSKTGTTSTTISSYLVRLLDGNLIITPKKSTPEVTKQIKDYNDTTGTDEGWGSSADYDIDDEVEFKITATLPTNYADYNVYYMLFTDTLSEGLTYTSTSLKVQVYSGDTLITTLDPDASPDAEYTVTTSGGTNGDDTSLKITIPDLKSVDNADSITSACTVVITYTAKLNAEYAVIGNPGNPNTVYLTYTNNPNLTGDGSQETTDTPETTVVAFTYRFDVSKTDDNGNALTGADFTLYKRDIITDSAYYPTLTTYSETLSGTYSDTAPSADYYCGKDASDNIYYVDATNSPDLVYYKMVKVETKTVTNGTEFDFKGLDDGTYVLAETTVPNGYNQADDVVFTVNATHDATAITALTVSDVTGGTITVTSPVTTGQLTTTVVNNSGAVIPETGGMGTKIFYTLGGILVVCAGVLLIVKRRMRNA